MPRQKTFTYMMASSDLLPHLLQVKAIHLGGEVALPALEQYHGSRLWRIQEDVRVGPLEFRQLRHAYSDFRYTGRALREEPVRRQPGRDTLLPDVLAQADVNAVVVLRNTL